jgi:K+-sensing histidine kinase KdpD
MNALIGKQQIEIEQGKQRAEKTEKELAEIKQQLNTLTKDLSNMLGVSRLEAAKFVQRRKRKNNT